jgi:mitosis inhibitor protein kinase SWE1
MLFIQTELCELGNLADFLLDFGQRYNRLDEPRVWKIMAELSNVRLSFSVVWARSLTSF